MNTQEQNVLDPAGLYERQEPLHIHTDQTVAIIGCGGVGMWVAYFLALAGIRKLHLFDSDTVSNHNLNRLPLTYDSVGKRKVEALAELIGKHRPHCNIVPHTNFDEESGSHREALGDCIQVVCCTDSLKSRQKVYKVTRDYGLAYLECGADGLGGSLSYEPPNISTELEENPGYQNIPVFVGPCVSVAAWACYYVLLNSTMTDRTLRIDWHKRVDSMSGYLQLSTILDNDPVEEEEEEVEGVEEEVNDEQPVLGVAQEETGGGNVRQS